jgi:hypothetical protein
MQEKPDPGRLGDDIAIEFFRDVIVLPHLLAPSP